MKLEEWRKEVDLIQLEAEFRRREARIDSILVTSLILVVGVSLSVLFLTSI